VRGQAEYIAELISLTALILVAYVAGSLALQLRELGLRLADDVYGSRENLVIVRINETHVEVRSGWDGDSEAVLMLLCGDTSCNATSTKISVPRWSSATVRIPLLSGNTPQLCIITARGNMFCSGDDQSLGINTQMQPSVAILYAKASCVYKPYEKPPYSSSEIILSDSYANLSAFYACTYLEVNGYNYSATDTGFPQAYPEAYTAVYANPSTTLVVLRRLNKVLLTPGYLYLQAYPLSGVMIVGEWDDIMDEVYQQRRIRLWTSYGDDPKLVAVVDHDDETFYALSVYPLFIDLGKHYDDGILLIKASSPFYGGGGIYIGDDIYEPPRIAFLFPDYGAHTGWYTYYFVIRFGDFGGGRYIWIYPPRSSLLLFSIEFYPPEALNRTIIPVPADSLQGYRDYPLTVTVFATPDSSRWFRLVEIVG